MLATSSSLQIFPKATSQILKIRSYEQGAATLFSKYDGLFRRYSFGKQTCQSLISHQ